MQDSNRIQRMAIEWTRAQPSVGRSIRSFVRDRAQAEDLLQEVALVIVDRFETMLQLDPVGRRVLKGSDKPRVFGQIIFDSSIAGLIASPRNLSETDALFGDPEGDYGDLARGVEPSPNHRDGKDAVILAADQRTLIANLAAASAVDQIRVLVSEPRQNKETEAPCDTFFTVVLLPKIVKSFSQ